jgi:hypothetical protein
MPTYEIDQYELCTVTYRVEAADIPEAIHKLDHTRDWIRVPMSVELDSVDNDRGLSVEEYPDLARQLLGRCLAGVEDFIPGIAGVREVSRTGLPRAPAPKLCVILESSRHGRECFDHYADVHEMLVAVYRLLESSMECFARDGIERTVGIAILPPEPEETDNATDHRS